MLKYLWMCCCLLAVVFVGCRKPTEYYEKELLDKTDAVVYLRRLFPSGEWEGFRISDRQVIRALRDGIRLDSRNPDPHADWGLALTSSHRIMFVNETSDQVLGYYYILGGPQGPEWIVLRDKRYYPTHTWRVLSGVVQDGTAVKMTREDMEKKKYIAELLNS